MWSGSCCNLCCGAPCRLDPCCSHLSGLHGFWRELPSQPQYWHAAQVNTSDSHNNDKILRSCLFYRPPCQLNSFLLLIFVAMCRCYEMERRLKTPDLFKFPYFEAICWYVAKNLLEMLKGESAQCLCAYEY